MKFLIFLGMMVGSYAGSYLPVLWGGGVFSLSSVILGAVGALLGIFGGLKLAGFLGLE